MFQSITERGITPNMTYDQIRRQKLTNTFYFLAFFACIVDVIDIAIIGLKTWVIMVHVVMAVVPLVLFYLNTKQEFRNVLIDAFFIIANSWIFFNACIYGPKSGIQYFYFPTIAFTFILIQSKEKLRLLLFTLFSVACVITLEVTHYSLFLDPSVSEKSIQTKYYTMFAVTIIQVVLASNYMVNVAGANEDMLENEKRELSKLNFKLDELNGYIESQNILLKNQLQVKTEKLLEQQKGLNSALIDAEEKERKRLSRDLHDGLGLILSTAKIKMQIINHDSVDKNKSLIDAIELIDKACIELRSIAQNLTPTLIAEIGIVASLKSIIHSINASKQVVIEFVHFGIDKLKWKGEDEVKFYRLILELLNNSLKHSFASATTLQLIYEEKLLQILLEDDGVGFRNHAHENGQGLRNMHAMVELYNGAVNIDSELQNGTTIIIQIPYE